MLISIQNPGATLVASFRSWRDDFERTVNKGEKAIRIISKFVLVPVFDIPQTSGKELPVLTEELTGDSPEARHLLEAVEKVCPIMIHYKSMRTEYWAKRMVTMI